MSIQVDSQIDLGWKPGTYIGVTPPKRSGASFCKVGQTIIMFGGQSDVTHYNDVWMLDISLIHLTLYSYFLNIRFLLARQYVSNMISKLFLSFFSSSHLAQTQSN